MKTTTRKRKLALFVAIIMVLSLWTAVPLTASAADNEVTVGDFTISRADGEELTLGNAAEYGNGDYFYEEENYDALDVTVMGALHINTSKAVIIEMKEGVESTAVSCIQINTAEDVTSEVEIQGVKIENDGINAISPFSVKGGGELSLTITGENVFDKSIDDGANIGAALQLENYSDIIIDGSGSLYAASRRGAGIGAPRINTPGTDISAGDITINGGTIMVSNVGHGAGIGAGCVNAEGAKAEVGDITINGGVITVASNQGAGIGAGYGVGINASANAGNITVNGGTIMATCNGFGGAGIGSGQANEKTSAISGNIEIRGGIVVAQGGTGGAGIGAGNAAVTTGNANTGDITINGGTVTAQAKNSASIGAGSALAADTTAVAGAITISGGTVTATTQTYGAGIGAGRSHLNETAITFAGAITINGGTIVATGAGTSQDIGNGVGTNGALLPLSGLVTIDGGSVIAVNNKIVYGSDTTAPPQNSAGESVYANTIDFNPALTSGDVIYAASIDGVNAAYTPDAANGVYGVRDLKALDIGPAPGGIGVKDIKESTVAAVLWLPAESESDNVTLVAKTGDDTAQYTASYDRGATAISHTLSEQQNPVDLFLATFDMQDHGAPIDSQIITSGNKVTEPETPTDTNYGFLGWYEEDTCTTPFDFTGTEITEDTAIYAKWAEKPVIKTSTFPDGAVGTAYNQTLAATGDTPITWEIDNGALPAGLSLNETSGAITGTPAAAGTFNFAVEATNAGGSVTKSLSITVAALPPPPPTTYVVTVIGGTGSASYAAGDTVTITANVPATGKVFDTWTGDVTFASATSATTSFTMPAKAVTVTANYKDDPNGGSDDPDTDNPPTTENGWVKQSDGTWKYYDDGEAETGWLYDTNYKAWYYLAANGTMQTGWEYVGGKWYYLAGNGAMKTGWVRTDGSWYYLAGNGAMVAGKWFKDADGSWYYLSGNGKMLTGKQAIGGKVYSFKTNGVWVS
jgi:uncharacterized repeat protein (TIGR02543 family)